MMPDVALVEFPPIKLKVRAEGYKSGRKGKEKRDGPLLVEEENIGPTLEKSVGCGETSKTTTNYDYLCHVNDVKREKKTGGASEVES